MTDEEKLKKVERNLKNIEKRRRRMINEEELKKIGRNLKKIEQRFYEECYQHDIRCENCPLQTKDKYCALIRIKDTNEILEKILKELPF